MEQRKINELKRRNARVVIKAGIPFKVFADDGLNNDQISQMMGWCDEADEEGLLPIQAEPISEEDQFYWDTWQAACDQFAVLHPERVAEIRNAKNGEEGIRLQAQMYKDASAYADKVCEKKRLEK